MSKKFIFLLSFLIAILLAGVFIKSARSGLLDPITDPITGTFGPDTPSTGDIFNDAKKLSSNDTPFPAVSYTIIPGNNIQSGQEVTLLENDQFFSVVSSTPKHFNWCIDNLPMAGKVAGGHDEIKQDGTEFYLENRYGRVKGGSGLCRLYDLVNDSEYQKIEDIHKAPDVKMKAPNDFYMTRIPNQDTDGDGLDDAWERLFAGRRNSETNTYYPSAEDFNALLAAVKPGDDPDKDGWDFTYTDAQGSGGTPSQTEYTLFKAPWMMGLVYAKGNVTGDGKWTNYEEFVNDTDPLNPDTDRDGVFDEGDAAGMGQAAFSVRANKGEGERYNVVLYAFGETQRWTNDKKSAGRQWSKYFRADFPNRRTGAIPGSGGSSTYFSENDSKKTPDNANGFQVSSSTPRQIQLGYSPSPAVYGEEVEVKAAAVSLSNEQPNLIYNWLRNGNPEKDKSGLNKSSYKFTPQDKILCQEIIGLEITDDVTKKVDYRELGVNLGLGLKLKDGINVLGNAIFNNTNENISKFNAKDEEGIDESSLINKNDPFLANGEVNNSDSGFRKGDLLEVSASGLKDNYNSDCFGGTAYDDFIKNANFIWTLNGTEMKAKSGQGKDFSKIKFILTGEPWAEPNSLSSDLNITQGEEVISLDVQDRDGNTVAKKTEKLKLAPPYIEMSVENAEKESSAMGKDLGKSSYSAKEGKKVKVTAHLYNFRPSKEGFTYYWERNGQEVAKEDGVESSIASYEFKVGYDESGAKNNISEEDVSLKVESQVDQELFEKEEAVSSLLVLIPERQPASAGAIGGALGRLAPSYYKAAFNIAFIPALVAIIVLFGLEFGKMRKRE